MVGYSKLYCIVFWYILYHYKILCVGLCVLHHYGIKLTYFSLPS